MEAARREGFPGQVDVGPPPRHVRRQEDMTRIPGLVHDLAFLCVLLRGEQGEGQPRRRKDLRQGLAGPDRAGADQDRLPPPGSFRDVAQDRLIRRFLGLENPFREHLASARLVQGHRLHPHLEEVPEFPGTLRRRPRQPANGVVEPKVTLPRDRGCGIVFRPDLHAFLRLHRLVQAIPPGPLTEAAPGELIDDADLFLLIDHVTRIPQEEMLRPQRVENIGLPGPTQQIPGNPRGLMDDFKPFPGQLDPASRQVQFVVLVHPQGRGQLLGHKVGRLAVVPPRTRLADDQGRSRFVDEHGVHFVDDGEAKGPLHHRRFRILPAHEGVAETLPVPRARRSQEHEVIPKVIKSEFIPDAVGHIRRIRRAFRFRRAFLALRKVLDRQAQILEDRGGELAVAFGQVAVHGDAMHPLPKQGKGKRRQGNRQSLALPRRHFRHRASHQDQATCQLGRVVEQAGGSLRGLPHDGERLFHHVLQLQLAGPPQGTPFLHPRPHRFLRHLRDRFRQGFNRREPLRIRLVLLRVGQSVPAMPELRAQKGGLVILRTQTNSHGEKMGGRKSLPQSWTAVEPVVQGKTRRLECGTWNSECGVPLWGGHSVRPKPRRRPLGSGKYAIQSSCFFVLFVVLPCHRVTTMGSKHEGPGQPLFMFIPGGQECPRSSPPSLQVVRGFRTGDCADHL